MTIGSQMFFATKSVANVPLQDLRSFLLLLGGDIPVESTQYGDGPLLKFAAGVTLADILDAELT